MEKNVIYNIRIIYYGESLWQPKGFRGNMLNFPSSAWILFQCFLLGTTVQSASLVLSSNADDSSLGVTRNFAVFPFTKPKALLTTPYW